ncbi:MAG: VWA domain-containing protein [Verrucomicrobiota bacterium]|jgi:hypothetical protein|nr:VWA domain-containing protein [Verrucomicrobiota bacterium]
MTFLAPLFLLGALAITGPLLFHLIRRNTKEKFTFSSLMFLRPDSPRVTRKSRLEDILLLLIRCALLVVMALAFARPFLRQSNQLTNDSSAGQRIVLLVDTSASMRRDSIWDSAVTKARSEIEKIKVTDTFAILAFDDKITPLLRFDQWRDLPNPRRLPAAQQAINRLRPGWGGTHLGNAIQSASDLLEEDTTGSRKRIILITDRQDGSRLEGLQGHDWPEDLRLTLQTIAPKSPGNAGLQLAPRLGMKGTDSRRVRVINSSDASREQFHLAWLKTGQRASTNSIPIYVPAGQSRTVTVPRQPSGADWRLALLGDTEEFDDSLFITPNIPEPIRIHYAGNDRTDDTEQMRFYLERVFSKTRQQHATVLAHEPSDLAAQLAHPDDRLLIISETIPQEHIAKVRAFCKSGHSVLLVLKDVSLSSTLSALAASGPVPLTEAEVNKYALLSQLDFEHPLLAPFSEPRFGDFMKIHFWKHRTLDPARLPGARVLARFDNGYPAMLDFPIERGHLFVLTSGWHPADSQLALSSKFVPLLYSMMELGSPAGTFKTVNLISQPITLSGKTNTLRTVKGPDGMEKIRSGTSLFHAKRPGIYTLQGTRPVTFAVNLSPRESRTDLLPMERLTGLKLPFAHKNKEMMAVSKKREQTLVDEQLEKRQKIWRWLIVVAILLVLLETWIGGWTWRRPAAERTTEVAA